MIQRIRLWLWTIDQRWLRWCYQKQQLGTWRRPGPGVHVTMGGKITASHYERKGGQVVHVIDKFEIASSAITEFGFRKLRDLHRQQVISALGIPECMVGKMYDDNYANMTAGDAFFMTYHGLDKKPKGGDDID